MPSLHRVDMRVQKRFKVGNKIAIDGIVEVFNVFNRTNFNIPNRIAFTPNFGRIFSALPARQMQFGVKLAF